ncbi:MAG TPA: T9SS type A sorting domain-containing protein, partial [Bacteroidia bacterium]|nr:T9SS type A sorting domain-containing protein [Bacteroidia bacterium]
FLIKFDPHGQLLWARSAGGAGDEQATNMGVDAMGHAYLCGSFASASFQYGTATLVNNGNLNIFMAEYDPFGNVLWARCTGGTASDFALSAFADQNGNAWMAGYFTSPSMSFDSHPVIFSGTSNMYVAKVGGITGIPVLSDPKENVRVNPNPSEGYFHFQFTTEIGTSCELRMYNARGELVLSRRVNPGKEFDLHAELMPAGLYLYTLRDKEQNLFCTGRLVIR